MLKQAIIPLEFAAASTATGMSPGIKSGNFIFVTGMAGGDLEGVMPDEPETQFRNAFDKIGAVLNEAGVGFYDVVEMTSYHVGLREHFEIFDSIRLEYLAEPYPAWTAVEVAGLRREGAIVEIRVVATGGA
ncbi:MAG: RidA family protein [Pseudomonadota bacterium]